MRIATIPLAAVLAASAISAQNQTPANPPPTSKVNPKDGLTYLWIPAGSFTMGCSPGDYECSDDEKPAHQVTITHGFWMGQTQVTQEAYERVAGSNPSNFKGPKLPVENINWNDAQGYCVAAGMRLPTEAEWEYAARAGSTQARYGSLDAIAWYADNSGNQRLDSAEIWRTDQANYGARLTDNGNSTHPVGQKQPNAWKLYDMLGNVVQWTADWYVANYYGGQDSQDPQGPPGGQQRVLRGGSWNVTPRYARVSGRDGSVPEYRSFSIGVRCAGN